MKRHPWHVHLRINRGGSRAIVDKHYAVKAQLASTAAARAVRLAITGRHKLTRITTISFTVGKVK